MSFENRVKERTSTIVYYLIHRKGLLSLAIGFGCFPFIYSKLKIVLQSSLFEHASQRKVAEESTEDKQYIFVTNNYDSPKQFLSSTQLLKTLKKTFSRHADERHQAINCLANSTELTDFDAYQFQHLCGRQTLIGLARHKETNPHFFIRPPPVGILEKSCAFETCLKERTHCSQNEEFCTLLSLLPSTSDKCVNNFTEMFSKLRKSGTEDKGIWLEDEYNSTGRSKRVPEETFEKYLLQALLRHSLLGDEQCQSILKNGGLQLLTKIYKLRENNDAMMCLTAKIIFVLSVTEKFHNLLHIGGWIGILHKWLQSSSVQLSSIAASTLANLDLDDKNQPLHYCDGLFLLSPCSRNVEQFTADVVFIHGIKGSAFRTWRQNDSMKDKNYFENRTKCWPKDWLADDTSNIRILAVDYESQFSEWNKSFCYEKERQFLQVRSKELMEKLVSAGVGRRPIIWVSHSMGGLIVKQILVNAASAPEGTSENNIFSKSSGLVFYSVPHIGTSLATKLSTQAQYLFFPSAELKQLQYGSERLKELHERFKEILKQKPIPCLSFGESKKTSFGLKFNAFIVDKESADIGIGEFYNVQSNHLNVCKPEDKESISYAKLLEFIYKNIPQSNLSHESIFNKNSASEREYFLLAFG